MSETLALPTAPKPVRKGPRPSAETIRKRVALMIGSGNVERLDKEGFAVVPAEMLARLRDELIVYVPPSAQQNGDAAHE